MTQAFPLQHLTTADGIRYGLRVAGAGPALVLLHGFTGSSSTWLPHTARLARSRRVVALDALGHGASSAPADPRRFGVEHAVRDVLTLLDRLKAGAVALLGYSMGGRLALHVALAAPERIEALMLESASPGIPDAVERDRRARDDEALAAAIEQHGVEAFVAGWEALPLFASQAGLPAEVRDRLRTQRCANSAMGLANSLRGMGAGVVPPVWERLGELQMPVLLIAGALDRKYVGIAQEMARRLPHAVLEVVANAGHAVHLEQPDTFDEMVIQFLAAYECQPSESYAKGHNREIAFRPLGSDEIEKYREIDRSELIEEIYVERERRLVLVPKPFAMKGFPPDELENLIERQRGILAAGGAVLGAFDGDTLVGIASVENRLRGGARAYVKMDVLHVSAAFRRKGIASRLIELAVEQGRAFGGRKLYISATPSRNTVDFYMRRGASQTGWIDPELFALEPEDIHLELDIP